MKVELKAMLDARENRAMLQHELIEKYGGALISFTMNIAGEEKTSPLIRRAFMTGVASIEACFKSIVFKSIRHLNTGDEGFFVVDEPPLKVKSIALAIEEETPFGRLFDIDVIGDDGEKLTRQSFRKCLLCDDFAANCARSRKHGLDTIKAATRNILFDCFSAKLSELCKSALITEVQATPKPGLVDLNNSGAHTDMSLKEFLLSAEALKPYFQSMARTGMECATSSAFELMCQLKEIGVNAERAMLDATGGVNTHKGAIFTLGLLSAAVGASFVTGNDDLSENLKALSSEHFRITERTSNGSSVEREYGVSGIRQEAQGGFLSAFFARDSLISYRECGFDKNDASILTLLELMLRVEDSNVLHRGGRAAYDYMLRSAKSVSKLLPAQRLAAALELDRDFIKRGISPGGCADMLAAGWFLTDILSLPC